MAHSQGTQLISLEASGDLSTKQYHFFEIDTNGQVAIIAAAGKHAVGVLYDDPSAAGRACQVATGSGTIMKVIAGGTIAKGDRVTSDSSGKATASITTGRTNTSDAGAANDPLIGSHINGIALDAGVLNDIIRILFQPIGAVPQTVQ
jgi:hypothetical protein